MGQSRPFAHASIALACSVATACLLSTDLDGLSGASHDSGAPDQGVVTAPDATDERSIVDAQVDSGTDGDATTARDSRADGNPCAVLFCSDWDESNDVHHGWTSNEVSGGGAIAIDTANPRSSPNAFAATMAPDSGFDGALLTQYFLFGTVKIHLTAYVYVDTLDVSQQPVSVAAFGSFHPESGPNSHVRVMVFNGNATLMEEYIADAGDQSHYTQTAYTWPLHKWLRLDVDVDVKAAVATMSVDGTQLAQLPLLGPWSVAKETVLKLGIYYSRGQSGQRVLFDDLTFDAK
jgi:hypothetical protein